MRITYDSRESDGFRSLLERKVADELDTQGVQWRYEVPVSVPDGRRIPYLPDFVIDEARDELMLPTLVECKPQQMLYDMRDALGVTRRAGEYFVDDVHVEGVTPQKLRDAGLVELAKPKALAQVTGQDVLIVGAVGGTRTLTATMSADAITFSRSHPFVNWRGVVQARERERRYAEERERWEAISRDNAIRSAAMEQSRGERLTRAREAAARVMATHKRLAPRFASPCNVCGEDRSDNGGLYRVQTEYSERWIRICATCETWS